MDISRSVKDAEIALRDFVDMVMCRKFGDHWTETKLDGKILQRLRQLKAEAESEPTAVVSEERLIYYAPLHQLLKIAGDFWESDFQLALGDLDKIKTYIKILEQYHTDHNIKRELFIYQKHLLMGVSGEIKTRLAAYRSLMETGREGFPRIEYVKDNFGNLWTPGKPIKIKTGQTLRVNDTLEFIVEATDPLEEPLEYRIHGYKWQSGNILLLDLTPQHVMRELLVHITIRSNRKQHAYPLGYDDRVSFQYQILPS